jgi:hypothetical protein
MLRPRLEGGDCCSKSLIFEISDNVLLDIKRNIVKNMTYRLISISALVCMYSDFFYSARLGRRGAMSLSCTSEIRMRSRSN